MKACALVVIAWISACSAFPLGALRAESKQAPEQSEAVSSSSNQKPAPRKTVSAGIADVLKMAERGVDASVIKSFVENYPVAYRPTADEVITLHEAGISSEIIATLLRRSGELR